MNYTPTCPYHTEVEVKAWGEGLTAGLHSPMTEAEGQRNRLNPYTPADTCTAWAQGWDDARYRPAPFNPAEFKDYDYEQSRYIGTSLHHEMVTDSRYVIKDSYLLYSWTGGTLPGKPDWANNRILDRAIKLDSYQLQRIIRTATTNVQLMGSRSIELPCPPYEYEYTQGGMSIQAGTFTKWGSKDDWERVISEMKDKFDEMPDGLNIENGYIDVNVTVEARTTTTVQLPISMMVEHEDGIFTGDESDLEDEVDRYISGMSDWELNDYTDMDDLDWSYADTEVVEFDAEDTGYDIRNTVTEA